MTESTPSLKGYTSKLEQRFVFFFVSVAIGAITYGILALFDILPEKPTTENASSVTSSTETKTEDMTPSVQEVQNPKPVKIIFDTLGGKEAKVLNPESSAVDVLDTALLSGVVRHPDSADFKSTGTIFILGHSSYLPVVHNKNFQAFNGIQKLVWGDTIRLQSNDTEYVYRVDRVYQAKASDAEIKLEKGSAKLVLATCNSFATKDDRYIVEAILVSQHEIAQNTAK